MKLKSLAFLCLPILSLACGRVPMEKSPEALVSYGLPSQHSNSEPVNEKKKETAAAGISWVASSAIEPKATVHY
ncbi:MAG: hypothetical protein EOP10_10845 [Proteobacteria bacterium]|nr:MAG: hypothetical protein EOP10_10845 [Pseudomonadota bacterium]